MLLGGVDFASQIVEVYSIASYFILEPGMC